MLKSDQQLPSVSSQTFQEPTYSMHKSKVHEDNKALATHGNSTLEGFGGKTKTNSILFFSFFVFVFLFFNGALPFGPEKEITHELNGLRNNIPSGGRQAIGYIKVQPRILTRYNSHKIQLLVTVGLVFL